MDDHLDISRPVGFLRAPRKRGRGRRPKTRGCKGFRSWFRLCKPTFDLVALKIDGVLVETGVVVRFDEERGYGFIEPDSGGEDVFIHASGLEEELKSELQAGRRVRFDAVNGHRGRKAFEVRLLEPTDEDVGLPAGVTNGESGVGSATQGPDLSRDELRHLLTEEFLERVPDLNGAQIVALREVIGEMALERGWVR